MDSGRTEKNYHKMHCRSYSLIGQLPIYPKEEDGNEAGIEEKMFVTRIQPPNMGA